MATHERDVAWRSLQSVFQALPEDAIVSIVKIGQPLPDGVAMTVKIEITGPAGSGDTVETWGAPQAKAAPAGKASAPPAKPKAAKSRATPPATSGPGEPTSPDDKDVNNK